MQKVTVFSRKRFYIPALCLFITHSALNPAQADWPNDGRWAVYSSFYNPDTGEGECVFRNTSALGQAYGIVEITFPAGRNQGLFDAATDNGWSFAILDDSTVFTPYGDQTFLQPGQTITLDYVSTATESAMKYATGRFRGPPEGLTCDPVLVQVPVPEPMTISFLCLGFFASIPGRWFPRRS